MEVTFASQSALLFFFFFSWSEEQKNGSCLSSWKVRRQDLHIENVHA